MTTIILAVLVLVAWGDLARRQHRIEIDLLALLGLVSVLRGDIMSISDDLNAKLDAIGASVTNLSEDVTTLKQMIEAGTNPDGSINPTDAAAILAKATALADQAAAAAGLFTPPTA